MNTKNDQGTTGARGRRDHRPELKRELAVRTLIPRASFSAIALEAQLLLRFTRRLPARLKKLLRRHQAIEPTIGHMKNDGLLDRNWLKGEIGDAVPRRCAEPDTT